MQITNEAPERCHYCGCFCAGLPLWRYAEHLARCPQRPFQRAPEPKIKIIKATKPYCLDCGEWKPLNAVHECKRKRKKVAV